MPMHYLCIYPVTSLQIKAREWFSYTTPASPADATLAPVILGVSVRVIVKL